MSGLAKNESAVKMDNQDLDDILVVISAMNKEADGVISVTFEATHKGALPEWQPGAHIDVLISDELIRPYSLAGDLDDANHWQIGVLREPDSRGGSAAIHSKFKVGDQLKCRGPQNNFPLVEAEEYVLIAGGIGVTPLLPIITSLELEGKNWKLLYGGRTLSSMGFLSRLKKYENKVQVKPEDKYGLLDLKGWIGTPRKNCVIYVCGPEPLIVATEKACEKWPEDALHLERFRPPEPENEEPQNRAFEVVLALSGMTVQVGADESIAEAVEREGGYIPLSCNEGTCGTCMTTVLEGIPDHRDHFLRGKIRSGNKVICCCCSRAKTDQLVLDI